MKIGLFTNIWYTKLLTWPFNLARDFTERMMTSHWLLKVPPCLGSRDWEFRLEAYASQLGRFRTDIKPRQY